jgi:DNA-binding MarR family transcriptional regulator
MIDEKIIVLRKISQQYAYTSLQMHENIARKAGFSGTDHKYLGFFLRKDKLTAGELADLTGLTTGAVTGLIDRFENKGLIKREFDKQDRRKIIVVPDSQKIIDLLAPFYQKFQIETDKLIGSFSHQEIEIIESYLSKSIELMKSTTKTIIDNHGK